VNNHATFILRSTCASDFNRALRTNVPNLQWLIANADGTFLGAANEAPLLSVREWCNLLQYIAGYLHGMKAYASQCTGSHAPLPLMKIYLHVDVLENYYGLRYYRHSLEVYLHGKEDPSERVDFVSWGDTDIDVERSGRNLYTIVGKYGNGKTGLN